MSEHGQNLQQQQDAEDADEEESHGLQDVALVSVLDDDHQLLLDLLQGRHDRQPQPVEEHEGESGVVSQAPHLAVQPLLVRLRILGVDGTKVLGDQGRPEPFLRRIQPLELAAEEVALVNGVRRVVEVVALAGSGARLGRGAERLLGSDLRAVLFPYHAVEGLEDEEEDDVGAHATLHATEEGGHETETGPMERTDVTVDFRQDIEVLNVCERSECKYYKFRFQFNVVLRPQRP